MLSFSLKTLMILMIFGLLSACSTLSTSSSETFEWMGKADQAYAQGRWLEAEKWYQKIIVQVPRDHYTWFRLGNTQLRLGNLDGAIYSYEESKKWNSRHSKTHYNLALAHMMKAQESLISAKNSMRKSDDAYETVVLKLEAVTHYISPPIKETKTD